MVKLKKQQNLNIIMNHLIVIGIPQMLYSFGIPDVFLQKCTLVQVVEDEFFDNNRPFNQTTSLFMDICRILKLQPSVVKLEDVESLQFSNETVVDVGLARRLEHKIDAKVKYLAAQHEYVNFMRPSILRPFSYSFLKRIEYSYLILYKKQIREFYSLAPNAKSNLFLKEKSLNYAAIRQRSRMLFEELLSLTSYKFLEVLEPYMKSRVLIVLPLSDRWGGSQDFNTKLLRGATKYARETKAELIIFKNHPVDPVDYKSRFTDLENDGMKVVFFCSQEERMFPLELITSYLENFQFYGIESTILMTSQYFWREPPVIVDYRANMKRKHINYELGEILKQYPHKSISFSDLKI